jgi:predicted ATPase
LIEALADAVKINSEGGKAGTKYASTSEQTELGGALRTELTAAGLRLVAGPRRTKHGFFLRAETLFNLARNVSGLPGFWGTDLEQQSHGEGFFTVFEAMFSHPGLYLLDELEAALSLSPACGSSTSCTSSAGRDHRSSARRIPRSSRRRPARRSSS